MARYATYPSPNASPITRRWIIRGLFISLLVHVAFLFFAYWKKLENFGFMNTARPVPAKFVVNKVTIDPKLLEPSDSGPKKAEDIKTPNIPMDLPAEKPVVKEIELKPNLTEVQNLVPEEKPKPAINFDKLASADVFSAGNDDKQLSEIAAALLKDNVRTSPNQRVIHVPKGMAGGDGVDGGNDGIPGRQSVDDALTRTGPLPAGDKIALKGGALFDYNKADLRRDAMDDLEKLGAIIQRNPNATFRIEGHTDSYGTREYNLELSQHRADAVKNWLVGNLHIDGSRIETIGFGSDKPIVPADKSVDEQQPNRRVEIVIKTNLTK